MTTVVCCVIVVIAAGGALRPRPVARRPGDDTDEIAAAPVRPDASGRLHRRPAAIEPGQVAAWCEQLARSVRGGDTLAAAIRSTTSPAPLERALAPIRLALERGASLGDAAGRPVTSPHLSLALAVVRACAVNGGPVSEPLDRAAVTLRTRAADRADRATQSAQARLSAVVMTVLPIGMLVVLLTTSAATRTAVGTRAGMVAVALGASLNLAGWWWMRRVIDRGDEP